MKLFIQFLLVSLFLMSFSLKHSQEPLQEIPPQIKTYIHKHFAEQKVVKYKAEVKPSKTKYKVYLDNHVKVEFDKGYNPVEIDSDLGLPESVLPNKILKYLQKNYQDMKVVEWEVKASKQEVELENGTELEFDLNGNFLRIDN